MDRHSLVQVMVFDIPGIRYCIPLLFLMYILSVLFLVCYFSFIIGSMNLTGPSVSIELI